MAAVMGFGGVNLSEKGLRIDPNLPPQWRALRFNIMYRGAALRVCIDQSQVRVDVGQEGGGEVVLRIAGEEVSLQNGQSYERAYRR